MTANDLGLADFHTDHGLTQPLDPAAIAYDFEGTRAALLNLSAPCYIARSEGRLGATNGPAVSGDTAVDTLAYAPPFAAEHLGDPAFCRWHGTGFSYYTGAMANGIASEELVVAMGKAGYMGSFGAGGLLPARVEAAIHRIQKELGDRPYALNLIHSPGEPAVEKEVVDLYLRYHVPCAEAAAFLRLTPNVVCYRVAGLSQNPDGTIRIRNRLIAKISRREVARRFLEPAPEPILAQLVSEKRITPEQASMAARVPMADDITAEADSGGHTDNRPLVSLLPSIISLRDDIQEERRYAVPVRVGAAGGIGTPHAAAAAFTMGAAYVVTGSVNQACVEAGASAHTRELLCQADMADMVMAPAADMFEMGVKLQVLRRGTFFPMRAQKLYDLYSRFDSIEEIPAAERVKLERQVFLKSLDDIWQETRAFFEERDPAQIAAAEENPKKKMALVFRWYLGLASRWSNTGDPDRRMDYQIWCGPCMGAFNAWVRGSGLEKVENRRVVDVAHHIMTGAAYLNRLSLLRSQGIDIPVAYDRYLPAA
jgi:trans-AT polyketide synthase/acyltransferase/oxidoreductase domain-containing protein